MLLLSLANELLLVIGEDLESQKDINAFARTNRRLYNLLNAYLYRRNVRDSQSFALLWSAQRGQVRTALHSISEGADLQAKPGRLNALQWAVITRSAEVVKLLLHHGANVDPIGDTGTPLQWILRGSKKFRLSKDFQLAEERQNSSNIAASLIQHGGDIKRITPQSQCTVLHYAASADYPSIVQLLLDKGADPNAQDQDLRTPLHHAMCRDYFWSIAAKPPSFLERLKVLGERHRSKETSKTVELLVGRGANLEARDKYGLCPWHYALALRDEVLMWNQVEEASSIP